MEKVRDGFYEGRVNGEAPLEELEGLEARLGEKVVRAVVWERGRVAEGEVYGGVEEYDPVLRSHCRLE